MNKSTLKNLGHAHAWLGLIISGVLMIVFVCGAMSLFRPSIVQWDSQYHAPTPLTGETISTASILDKIIAQDHYIPAHHSVLIALPTEKQPYFYTDFETETPDGHHIDHQLNFDANTGEQIALDFKQFYLSQMLYDLHISLLIPYGKEMVGVISILFFVMLISGICMILKKLISHFYQYRLKKSKDTYLDGHTLIGISSLPFTIIFALTGIMFNLSIILQAAFGYAVFKGDIPALIQTAGFFNAPDVEYSGKAIDNRQIDNIIRSVRAEYPDSRISTINIYAPGDENGVVEVRVRTEYELVPVTHITYALKDGTKLDTYNATQAPAAATYITLSSLHFGEFGGITLKFIYFIMSLSCCYLILTGNLIWLEKRENNRHQSKKGLAFVKAMTLALSTGTLIAVACSFIGARFTPISWDRTTLLPALFFCAIGISLLHAIFNGMQQQRARVAMIQQLFVAALLFTLCPTYDLIQILFGHTTHTYQLLDVVLINIVLVLVAGFCFSLAQYKRQGLVQSNAFDDSAKPILE